jgi:hypothetical protein
MLFGLRAFRFLHTVLSKETFFFLYPTSFIHPISIPSSFSISPRFFLSLSLISPHPLHICSIVSLSLRHILHLLSSLSVQFLFSLSLPLSFRFVSLLSSVSSFLCSVFASFHFPFSFSIYLFFICSLYLFSPGLFSSTLLLLENFL